MCRRYAQYHDREAGDNAVGFLREQNHPPLASETAVECLKLVLESKPSQLSDAQDVIIAELARQCVDIRLYMAAELQASTTEFFDNLYERGDQAANCLRTVALESSLWSDEAARIRVEEDLFQLFLAKLMESGHDLDGRALKGIALLLLADASHLKDFVDEEGFDALLTSLDVQLPADVRGQATLVISKYLEVSEASGQAFISKFITVRAQRQNADDLVLALSAAASLFAVAPSIISPLFLREGLLPGLLPVMDRKLTSDALPDAFLMLLNAACIDAACRNAIANHCGPWLSHKVSNGTERQNALAATILAKLRTAGSAADSEQRSSYKYDDVSDLVDLFQSTIRLESEQNVSNSIEGLAYASLKPEVKEKLANDTAFLKTLLQVLDANSGVPEVVIGGLSTISNIAHYQPNLSEEQKRISQLRAYARASKPVDPNPLDDDTHVTSRCAHLIGAGVVPTLVHIDKTGSSISSQLTDRILLSLSKNPKTRGKIAQQGAVRLLISHLKKAAQSLNKTFTFSPDAAHALARILVSLDPSLVFPASGTPHITDAISALVLLLKPPTDESLPLSQNAANSHPLSSDQPRDLLPTFESLLALTNLASSPNKAAADSIIRTSWDTLEDLMLSHNTMIRRASVELVCNLCTSPHGVAKFADGSVQAKRRCHVLLAMADVDDLATRRAAGGALAMLTEFSEVIEVVIEFGRCVDIVLGLCEEEDLGVRHRGLVVVDNMLNVENATLVGKIKEKFMKQDVGEKVKHWLKSTKDVNVLQVGVDVLKKLQSL